MKENKQKYQIVLVLNPKTGDKEVEKINEKLVGLLTAGKAEIVKTDHQGAKQLVYLIKGHDKGDFWVYEVESSTNLQLKEINLFLNREANIIRYLILKK